MRFVLSYAGMSLLLAMGLASTTPMRTYYLLSRSGVTTHGEVVRSDCPNHGYFLFRFQVDGRPLEALGQSGVSKECRALVPGDDVLVTYMPRHPGTSVSGDPSVLLKEEMRMVAIAAIVIPLPILLSLSRLKRRVAQNHGA
jgi:hypothetical protein